MNTRVIVPTTRSRGKVKIQVVHAATGKIAKEYNWQKNLILNGGLDMVCETYTWADCFRYCAAGTSSLATSETYPSCLATQAGTTVTASNFDFTAVSNQYNVIKWDTGEEALITAVTDTTHVEVLTSQSVSSGKFTVYRTNQTGLGTEVARTNTYLAGSGNCGTTLDTNAGTLALRRTFDFSVEVSGPIVYTEIALTPLATGPAFARILLSSPVTVLTGQFLRVVYDLTVTQTPIAPVASNPTITNWPIAPAVTLAGDEQSEVWGIAQVSTLGATVLNTVNALEPSVAEYMFLSNEATALATFPTGTTGAAGTTTDSYVATELVAYTTRDFFRIKSGTFGASYSNGTDLRSMGLMANNTAGFRFLFDEAQTKTNLASLQLNFVVAVGRWLT